jgi:ribonuclease D
MLPDILKEKILGFDTETRACFKKGESYPPSLVQLAGESMVYVIQLSRLKDLNWFGRIFSDDQILKAGVSLAFDVRKLREMHEFEPAGFCELARLADRAGIKNNGLRGLSALVLGFRITKGAQRSDWSRPTLSSSQLLYAATDAWASRELYLKLMEKGGRVEESKVQGLKSKVGPADLLP